MVYCRAEIDSRYHLSMMLDPDKLAMEMQEVLGKHRPVQRSYTPMDHFIGKSYTRAKLHAFLQLVYTPYYIFESSSTSPQ